MGLKIPKTVKMIITDFDGVMTDNCIYITQNIEISRKLNFKDIMGVSRLRQAGFDLAFISGEKNHIMDFLAEKFAIKEVHHDVRIKIEILKSIVEKYNLKQGEFLYIGDDINDIDCLNFSSIKITVPNSTPKVKKVKGIQITKESGGNGAFREVVDCLLNS